MMKRYFDMTLAAFACVLLIGAVPQVRAQGQSPAEEAADAQADSAAVEANPMEYSRPVLTYDSGGKRDPFRSNVSEDNKAPEEKLKGLFSYEGATLKGIVNSSSDSYALVADADNFGYVLREGYRVFGGYVTRITDDAVHLHIVKYGRSMSIIMRLESSRSTVVVEDTGGGSTIQKPGITIDYREAEQGDTSLSIDEVKVPSLSTKTIEEEWFGGGGQPAGTPERDDAAPPEADEVFSLIDPPDETWIELPYILDWTMFEGDSISYSVIIDDTPDFTSPLYTKNGIVTSSHLLQGDAGLPVNTTLHWKVIARTPSGASVESVRTDMSFKIIGNQ